MADANIGTAMEEANQPNVPWTPDGPQKQPAPVAYGQPSPMQQQSAPRQISRVLGPTEYDAPYGAGGMLTKEDYDAATPDVRKQLSDLRNRKIVVDQAVLDHEAGPAVSNISKILGGAKGGLFGALGGIVNAPIREAQQAQLIRRQTQADINDAIKSWAQYGQTMRGHDEKLAHDYIKDKNDREDTDRKWMADQRQQQFANQMAQGGLGVNQGHLQIAQQAEQRQAAAQKFEQEKAVKDEEWKQYQARYDQFKDRFHMALDAGKADAEYKKENARMDIEHEERKAAVDKYNEDMKLKLSEVNKDGDPKYQGTKTEPETSDWFGNKTPAKQSPSGEPMAFTPKPYPSAPQHQQPYAPQVGQAPAPPGVNVYQGPQTGSAPPPPGGIPMQAGQPQPQTIPAGGVQGIPQGKPSMTPPPATGTGAPPPPAVQQSNMIHNMLQSMPPAVVQNLYIQSAMKNQHLSQEQALALFKHISGL
jgi:hypothetical protein